jgi:hypothetical protein
MPTIVKGIVTKEEDEARQERLKGKGFEHPCYLEEEPPVKKTKPKKIKMK